MKKIIKKSISSILALIMIVSALPLTVSAVEPEETDTLSNGLVGYWNFDEVNNGSNLLKSLVPYSTGAEDGSEDTYLYGFLKAGNNDSIPKVRNDENRISDGYLYLPGENHSAFSIGLGETDSEVAGAAEGTGFIKSDTESFSVSIWMKFEQTSGNMCLIQQGTWNTDGGGNTSGPSLLFFDGASNVFRSCITTNGNNDTSVKFGNIRGNNSTWHHFVITNEANEGASNNKFKLYVDGVKFNFSGINNDVIESGCSVKTRLIIGAHRKNSDTIRGELDEVRIYNRAISEEEVRKICALDIASVCADQGSGITSLSAQYLPEENTDSSSTDVKYKLTAEVSPNATYDGWYDGEEKIAETENDGKTVSYTYHANPGNYASNTKYTVKTNINVSKGVQGFDNDYKGSALQRITNYDLLKHNSSASSYNNTNSNYNGHYYAAFDGNENTR